MNPALLFYLLCIPIRLILAYVAYKLDKMPPVLQYSFIILTTAIGLGFWSIYLNGWRKTGLETGGKPIWWNNLRPIHGSLYLLYAGLALSGVKNAWVVLLIDVIIGFAASARHNIA